MLPLHECLILIPLSQCNITVYFNNEILSLLVLGGFENSELESYNEPAQNLLLLTSSYQLMLADESQKLSGTARTWHPIGCPFRLQRITEHHCKHSLVRCG